MDGEALGLFARTGPLSLKSGEGPVKIQAQHADLRLLADGYSEYFILRDRKTGAPLKDFPYSLSYGGRTFHDKTGDDGRTQRGWSIQSEELELTPHPERYQRQLLDASYWEPACSMPEPWLPFSFLPPTPGWQRQRHPLSSHQEHPYLTTGRIRDLSTGRIKEQ